MYSKILRQNARQKTISKKLFLLYIVYMVDFLLWIVSLTHKAPHKPKSLKQIESLVLDIAQILLFWSFLTLQVWNNSLCSIWYHCIFTRFYIIMKPKVWAFQSSTWNCSQVNDSFKKVCQTTKQLLMIQNPKTHQGFWFFGVLKR